MQSRHCNSEGLLWKLAADGTWSRERPEVGTCVEECTTLCPGKVTSVAGPRMQTSYFDACEQKLVDRWRRCCAYQVQMSFMNESKDQLEERLTKLRVAGHWGDYHRVVMTYLRAYGMHNDYVSKIL